MFRSASGFAALLVLAALSLSPQVYAADATDKPGLVNLWQPGDPGQRLNIRGRITTLDGTPVAGASIYIRQADGNGDYIDRYSANLESDDKGRYQFGTVLPGQYYGTKHIHLWVTHDSYSALDTEILFKGDPNLADEQAPNAIFLEESTVNGETILYGRFDITLAPE